MIIKVPIYVELSKPIEQEKLPDLVAKLTQGFSSVLRKENIANLTGLKAKPGSIAYSNLYEMKVITREKALDALRTSK